MPDELKSYTWWCMACGEMLNPSGEPVKARSTSEARRKAQAIHDRHPRSSECVDGRMLVVDR